MDKLGGGIQKSIKQVNQEIKNGILKRELPYLNLIARDMVLCKDESRRYAICVSSKGITVQMNECKDQFKKLMDCMGLKIKS